MTNILTLDLGTTTGFAVGRPGASSSGSWPLKPARGESAGMRGVKFIRQLDKLQSELGISFVFYEEVKRHAGTYAAQVYGGLAQTLMTWCVQNNVEYAGVPVGTIKKWATGKGNADKAAMMNAARCWGYEPGDDNEADAIAIFEMKCTEGYCGVQPEQREEQFK